jgi:glycosyltransferase involved in cell wall biosynthesis
MNPLSVSVVIPTYNRAHLLPRALHSVVAATRPGDEILVVDDGSTDNTEEVVAGLQKQTPDRIHFLQAAHGGAGAARNVGVRAARNPFVAFMDSDDEWMPDALNLHRTVLEHRPDVVFTFANLCLRLPDGSETPHNMVNWHHDTRGWDEILGPGVPFSSIAPLPAGRADFRFHVGDMYLRELERDYISMITMVVRRELAGDALHFPEDLPIGEDKECFGRLTARGPAAWLDCDTAWNWGHDGPRVSDANTPTQVENWLKFIQRVWGSDRAFLAKHGDLYAEILARQYCKRAQWLLVRGRTREAREDLRRAKTSPLSYRMLAALPGFMAKSLLGVRRALLGNRAA